MKDVCEATQLSGEEELEVSRKSSLPRPFFDQRSFFSCFDDLRQMTNLNIDPCSHRQKNQHLGQ